MAGCLRGQVSLVIARPGHPPVVVAVDPDTAAEFAADIIAAVSVARRIQRNETTRPMCRVCWKDTAACTCATSSPRKGGRS